MHTILSLLLALVLAFTASGHLADLRDVIDRRQDRLEAAGDALLPQDDAPAMAAAVPGQTVDWNDVVYEHVDPNSFYEAANALAEARDAQAVTAGYDALYDELAHASTQAEVAYIRCGGDVTDSYWSDESVYSETVYGQMYDAFLTACHGVMEGPCADALRDHVEPDLAAVFESYEPMSDREAELSARAAELTDQYYELMASAGDMTYPWQGQDWTQDMIDGFQGADLASRDYDAYLEVYFGLQKAVCGQVGPIFQELVDLRTEQAALTGYESFTDMAYETIYLRDYGPDEAQALCDAVKPLAREYYDSLYYYAIPDGTDDALLPDSESLLDALSRCVTTLDPALEAPFAYMTEHGLTDIGAGAGRQNSSYTTYLPEYGMPFIFFSQQGDCYDLSGLTHEFGHFADLLSSPPADLFTQRDLDLMEIPSTALEALGTFCYDDIYGDSADSARTAVLCDLFGAVVDGCIYDEFQREVYARPDMTLDEISALFADISAQYGVYEPTGVDYYWIYIPHNFTDPLYYISYAASALAVIQIWDAAREDLAAGVGLLEDIMAADKYHSGYVETLEQCGLTPFTRPGAVEEICAPFLDELARMAALS